MKKKMLVLICTLLLAFGMTMTAAAEGSPQGKKDTTQTEDKSDKAPATGEGNALIYAAAAAVLLTGTAVLSAERLKKAEA